MYVITGVTGHVGGAAATQLLAAGEPVRVVVRDEDKGADWARQGAEVAIADFGDQDALAAAFRGASGVFVMLPTIPTETDTGHRRMADTIAAAVRDSGVDNVVMLSSIGADVPDGTGVIRWIYHLEQRLRDTGVRLSAIRSNHFQEKVETVLGAAVGDSVYPVFGDWADVPTSMIATRDVGTAVVESLLSPPAASEVVDLDGPQYTERQVAEKLGVVLGKPLQVVTIPRPGWVEAMVGAGLPPAMAEELAEFYGAEQDGLLQPRGDRQRWCATEIDSTLREVVGQPA